MENERVRRRYFKDLNRKVYIERALEIIRDEGTEAISIRRMAKEFQRSITSMYRYFENVEELLYYANLGYLDEYLEELNVHGKEWHNIWDMHIGIWECYCRIVFRYPQAFDIIFFSATSRNLTTTIRKYYDMLPERINIVSPYLQVMLQSTDLFGRDMVMTERCAQAGVITMGNAVNMNRTVCLLYKEYLREALDYGLEPNETEGKVQKFKRDVEVTVGIYVSDTLGHDYLANARQKNTRNNVNCRGCRKRFPRLIFYEARIQVMQTGGTDMSKKTTNGYYTVYTRQSRKVLEELEKTGEYRVKEEYIRMKNDSISECYLKLYRWFAERCRERIDVPKGCSLPIWLSMHDEYRLRNTEDTACLTLRISREKARVISEYAWGFRVNYMYIPLNLEDERAFNGELKRYGTENEMVLVIESLGNYYPILRKRIISSWDRIFELKPNSPADELGICFEIQEEWIENIESLT